ncbi:histidine kinase famiy protein [Sphingomonas jatrophae]|uniref:histidine kinase n=1 Tax=Sphingomonas jatrophae TaxID=1166337 RepID=A0A1I6JTC6_9SPHN|nr:histidine kinase famiy protein [Sphingomonas jatrophae]SFR82171.1 PAS domain S-box-containing protein [Sphingomonas jatrophae]
MSSNDTETGAEGGPPPTIDGKGSAFAQRDGRDIFFAAVETTRMPMIVTDPALPDNPIIFCNNAFSSMTGYAMEEIVGQNCRFLQGPDTDRATIAEVREGIEARREVSVEVLNYRKNGSTFWNALFISPVYASDGSLAFFFASQLDISRRRDAENALRQAQKMEAVGQLTGGIAHDFNNLLQVIVGYVDLLQANPTVQGEPRVGRAVEAIAKAASRGATLTQQLLAFARKQDLKGRIVNLNALVEGFRSLIERTLSGGAIEVRYDLGEGLANARVDAVQAEMALLNILINARDAMPDGGRITIRTENRRVEQGGHRPSGTQPGDYVALSVEDDGAGIPADILAKVFEPFFTTKEVGKGTGLGLSMVYGFMKQSGGGVSIDSTEGKGTTVTLLFPRADGNDSTQTSRRRDQQPGSESILLVEDQEDVALLGETILSDFGYRVTVANDARAALDVVERGEPIDLLFTDIVMPGGMNGVVLAREVRRRRPKCKILLTTGYADSALDASAEATEEFDVLHKPYRRQDLIQRVRQILDGPTGVS